MYGKTFLQAKFSYPLNISKCPPGDSIIVTSLLCLCSFCRACCCYTQFYSSVASMASWLQTMVAMVTSKSSALKEKICLLLTAQAKYN